MRSKWQMFFLGLTVIICTSVPSSLTTGEDMSEVSAATLAQMKLIKNSIDRNVDPCDNFYNYACGKWEDQEITLGNNKNNHIIYEQKFLNAIENMLIQKYPRQEDIKKQNQSFADKVMTFFYSCKNGGLLDFLEELKPDNDFEWPLVNDLKGKPATDMQHFDLFAFLGHLYGYGLDNFLLNRSVRRESNGSLYVALDLPHEQKLETFKIDDMLVLVGYDDKTDKENFYKYRNEIQDTHNKWLTTYKQFSAENSGVFSFSQVKQQYPQLAKFLDIMLLHQLKVDDLVEISNIKYMEFLITKKWQPPELRQMCNYVMAVLFKYVFLQFKGQCVEIVQSKMHFAVNYMYRQHFYTAEVKSAFQDLKEKIYKYLLEMVDENYLQFNAAQLNAIKDKLARTYVSIGNVPEIADDAMVEQFYRHMPDLDINNFSQNLLMSLKQRFWESYNCPDNMECFEEVEHGTYNVVEKDLIIIALASLTPAMYDWTFDPIFAVSLMGIFIGHEYAHSIDTDSLMDSNLYDSLHEEFEKHSNISSSIECTNQQYEPTDYLRQLQADLVGARAAFRAYKTDYRRQPSFTKIRWRKLFFLNYAQYYCQWEDYSVKLMEHVARTNYVAMNMEEFAKAFKCPAGSKMNPVKKCLLY